MFLGPLGVCHGQKGRDWFAAGLQLVLCQWQAWDCVMDTTESESAARQLLKVLVDAGFDVDEPVQNAWVQSEALRALGLQGEALDSALTLAGEQGWIESGPGPGTLVLTMAGLGTVRPMK